MESERVCDAPDLLFPTPPASNHRPDLETSEQSTQPPTDQQTVVVVISSSDDEPEQIRRSRDSDGHGHHDHHHSLPPKQSDQRCLPPSPPITPDPSLYNDAQPTFLSHSIRRRRRSLLTRSPAQSKKSKRTHLRVSAVVIPPLSGLPPIPPSIRLAGSEPSRAVPSVKIYKSSRDSSSPAVQQPPLQFEEVSDPDFEPGHEDSPSLSDDDYSEEDRRRTGCSNQATSVVLLPIYRIFRPYFPLLKSVWAERNEGEIIDIDHHHLYPSIPLNSQDPTRMVWTQTRPWIISQRGEDFYQSVTIDRQILKTGSVVKCLRKVGFSYRKSRVSTAQMYYGSDTEEEEEQYHREGEDQSKSASRTTSETDHRWFLIRAFFERDGHKFFHGTWLEPASQSFMGRAANPRELLLVDQCYEIRLEFTKSIEHVYWITESKQKVPNLGHFCRFHWSPTHGSFINLPIDEPIPIPNPLDSSKNLCSGCFSIKTDIRWLLDPITGDIATGTSDEYEALGFVLRGQETYKLNDFVRASALKPEEPDMIGQIVEICGIRANPNSSQTILIDEGSFQAPNEVICKLRHSKHKPTVTIRLYSRSSWYGTEEQYKVYNDDRQLWVSTEERLIDAKEQLKGKCDLIHLESDQKTLRTLQSRTQISQDTILTKANCFYTILPTKSFQRKHCSIPLIDKQWKSRMSLNEPKWIKINHNLKSYEEEEKYDELVKNYECMGKLRHLELFCGIGSMSVALMELGLTAQESSMFIDLSISACETIALNFPRSRVICADLNEVLELIVTGQIKKQDHIIDRRTQRKLYPADLPKPGDFDLITAGFPCGSHSTLNVLRKANDDKNALCATALSFVAYLKPDYVFLENVRGLLKTKFRDPVDDTTLDKAFLRLICASLIESDYQVRFGVLQAAQFGAPQERRRIIFSATRRGLTAPELPDPTHHFQDSDLPIVLPTSNKNEERRVIKSDYRKSSTGALRAVTVGEAIMDLPAFEYKNPMKIMGDFERWVRKKLRNRMKSIKILERVISNREEIKMMRMIGFERFEYKNYVQNNYQHLMRKDLSWKSIKFENEDHDHQNQNELEEQKEEKKKKKTSSIVWNWHVTSRWSDKTIERIWHIPFKAGADHRSLPTPLKLNIKHVTNINDFDGNFGRLDLNEQFKTIITTMNPQNQGKCGRVLHPLQHRTLTVLEAQRAQGFPDWYRLHPGRAETKDPCIRKLYRLIGNAIPVQICNGLGRELLKVKEIDWIEGGKKIENDVIVQQAFDLCDFLLGTFHDQK